MQNRSRVRGDLSSLIESLLKDCHSTACVMSLICSSPILRSFLPQFSYGTARGKKPGNEKSYLYQSCDWSPE